MANRPLDMLQLSCSSQIHIPSLEYFLRPKPQVLLCWQPPLKGWENECPRLWENLTPTDQPKQRFCEQCRAASEGRPWGPPRPRDCVLLRLARGARVSHMGAPLRGLRTQGGCRRGRLESKPRAVVVLGLAVLGLSESSKSHLQGWALGTLGHADHVRT